MSRTWVCYDKEPRVPDKKRWTDQEVSSSPTTGMGEETAWLSLLPPREPRVAPCPDTLVVDRETHGMSGRRGERRETPAGVSESWEDKVTLGHSLGLLSPVFLGKMGKQESPSP